MRAEEIRDNLPHLRLSAFEFLTGAQWSVDALQEQFVRKPEAYGRTVRKPEAYGRMEAYGLMEAFLPAYNRLIAKQKGVEQ